MIFSSTDHFTKTGSGQTQRKTQKKTVVSGDPAAAVVAAAAARGCVRQLGRWQLQCRTLQPPVPHWSRDTELLPKCRCVQFGVLKKANEMNAAVICFE
jgi:hypothetical protein